MQNIVNIKQAATALGGDIHGINRILCPGPGHSRKDRSMSVTFTDDGFLCHSFAGDDFRECRDHIKAALGIGDDRQIAFKETITTDPIVLANEAERTASGLRLWGESVPIAGTLAEQYLHRRGLAYVGAALRFHAARRMMVALMTNALTGAPQGVHRTFLGSDGRKIDRKMLGVAKGAIVRLSGDDEVSDGLGIAEGIETALATGFAPVWACLSAGTMRSFPLLEGIGALTIFADNDVNGTGFEAANECGRRWHESGREVAIGSPDKAGEDFADLQQEAA